MESIIWLIICVVPFMISILFSLIMTILGIYYFFIKNPENNNKEYKKINLSDQKEIK